MRGNLHNNSCIKVTSLTFTHSPSIRAASEKLAALKSAEKKSVSPAAKAGSPSSQTIPSASTEVLEAQRKRFEDLKVSQFCCFVEYVC